MSALSASAQTDRFHSGRYLHQLLGGTNGEMEPDPYREFVAQVSERARQRRLELGLETDDVARRVTNGGHKLKGSSLENWERGDLPLKHVGRLAEALEMPWQQLLGLAPMPVRSLDPLAELEGAVTLLIAELREGTGVVSERLAAIERRLPGSDEQVPPRDEETPSAG